jgi:hypothetical protein
MMAVEVKGFGPVLLDVREPQEMRVGRMLNEHLVHLGVKLLLAFQPGSGVMKRE